MNIKEKLRYLRNASKKTQQEIAEQAEVSIAVYKRYESGEALPNAKNLLKLAELFDVSMDELCGRWETTKEEAASIRLQKIKKLDEEEKQTLDTVIEGLLLRHYSKNVMEI